VLLAEFLPEAVREAPPVEPVHEPVGATAGEMLDDYIERRLRAGDADLFGDVVRHVKRRLLTLALQMTGGNQLQAARLLGVSRSTLRNELKTLGITVERSVATGGASAADDATSDE
jgi:two-component system nitrogen regulation response regulator GlnG